MPQVVVVGAGVSGLVTALRLFENNTDVVVVDAADRVGGKVLTTEMRGVAVDAAADAFLVRQPYMQELCRHLNLEDDLVSPQPGPARLWLQGALRPLPRRQYLGVPLDPEEAAENGILSPEGVARALEDLDMAANAPSGDESAGSLVRRRLGDEVMDRLVGPLLGGINAGDADQLSLQAGVPQLAAAAGFDASLIRSIPQYLQSLPRDPDAPIFQAHPNGMAQITDAIAERLRGRIHLSRPVRALSAAGGRWLLETDGEPLDAEAVVLTTPAFVAAPLLESLSPRTAQSLSSIEYASVVMVTFAFPSAEMPEYEGSGFLVPKSEGLLMSACSWASSKWGHLGAGPTTFLRVSSGRFDDRRAMDMDDDELVAQLLQELEWTAGVTAEPDEVRITRWPQSLPQYRPGHLEKVAGIESMLADDAPGVFVTGAAYRGLGLPACVHQATVAAHNVSQYLA